MRDIEKLDKNSSSFFSSLEETVVPLMVVFELVLMIDRSCTRYVFIFECVHFEMRRQGSVSLLADMLTS